MKAQVAKTSQDELSNLLSPMKIELIRQYSIVSAINLAEDQEYSAEMECKGASKRRWATEN